MARLSRETQQVLADSDWWSEFGSYFGWRLYGFSYRYAASFIGEDEQVIEVTRYMRDSIYNAMFSAQSEKEETR